MSAIGHCLDPLPKRYFPVNIQDTANLINEIMNDLTGDIVRRSPRLLHLWFAAFYMEPESRAFYLLRGVVAHAMGHFSIAMNNYDEALQREAPPGEELAFVRNMLNEIQTYRQLASDEQPLPFSI